MISTSISEGPSGPLSDRPSDIVAQIDNLSLSFRTDMYRAWTMRDLFTRVISNPISTLSQRKDRLVIIENFNLTIRRGERVGFLGVNGTGKTSLCRCLAGIYSPNQGQIQVAGRVRAIFDTTVGILPELTGRENARLLAEFMYPEFYRSHKELIDEALEFSELGKFVDTPYRLYSNGMQARLCLSMVSCRPCDLLILDEVFDGDDIFFREKISKRILNIVNQ